MTTDEALVSPDLYLSITAEHYMREHLFDSPALIAHVCQHFHPEVNADHVERWRTQYSSIARPGDRTGMTVHPAEREAVAGVLGAASSHGLDNRETIRRVCRETLRVLPSVYAAEQLATRASHGSVKVPWSVEEDAQLLNGRDVRGESVDASRRARLRKLLGYRKSIALPSGALPDPAADDTADAADDAGHAAAAFDLPSEPPLLTMNVAEGVSVAVDQSATVVTVTAGHESVLLTADEAKKLADALGIVARVTEVTA